jgi:hypothetical protein
MQRSRGGQDSGGGLGSSAADSVNRGNKRRGASRSVSRTLPDTKRKKEEPEPSEGSRLLVARRLRRERAASKSSGAATCKNYGHKPIARMDGTETHLSTQSG